MGNETEPTKDWKSCYFRIELIKITYVIGAVILTVAGAAIFLNTPGLALILLIPGNFTWGALCGIWIMAHRIHERLEEIAAAVATGPPAAAGADLAGDPAAGEAG